MSDSREIILPRRVVVNPQPPIHDGGDCGACCLAGLLGVSVDDVYSRYSECGEKAFSWVDMRETLGKLKREGLLDRVIDDVPNWHSHAPHQVWGPTAMTQALAWRNYVLMALDAGYYGLCGVRFNADGPFEDCDHWVMLCGYRDEYVPTRSSKGRWRKEEFLVSCSARNPAGFWVERNEFLRKHGGFNVLLARPTDRAKG